MRKPRAFISLPVAIGLGLLIVGSFFDNIRGPLLPHIATNMGFSYSGSSFFLVIGHLCAGCAAVALLPALNHFSERAVTWASLAFGFMTCGAATLVHSYWQLLLFAGALGVCTSVLGTMSNVVIISNTATERAGRNMALLHVMYGAGSTLGTVAVGQVLAHTLPWSLTLLVLIPVIAGLAWQTRALTSTSLPDGRPRQQPLGLAGEHWLIVWLFAFYVAGEVLTSMWMTTFLVEADGKAVGDAAWFATTFFVIMTASRLILMVIPVQRWAHYLLGGSLVAGLVFSVLGLTYLRWCLPLVGLLGPFFPLLLARASQLYPQRNRTIVVYVIIGMQVALGTLHFIIGQISHIASVSLTYWIAPLCLAIACVLFTWHMALTVGTKKTQNNSKLDSCDAHT